ncbi:hypothetical protein MMC31_003088 [Peltigera leucophlebia]|nr:hypothetical protein [Peltigera leucophlebia]
MRMRRMLPADFLVLGDIATEAFWNDEVFAWIFPHRAQFPEDFKNTWVDMFRFHLHKPGWHCFVSETEEVDPIWSGRSELAGFAMWERQGHSNAAKFWQQDNFSNCTSLFSIKNLRADKVDDSRAERNLQRFGEVLEGGYAEEKERWYLLMIGVSPKHQRHGIGTSLIDWGLERAQEEGVICILESSEAGQGLYERKGFRKVGLLEMAEGATTDQMVWRPK